MQTTRALANGEGRCYILCFERKFMGCRLKGSDLGVFRFMGKQPGLNFVPSGVISIVSAGPNDPMAWHNQLDGILSHRSPDSPDSSPVV